MMKPRFLAAILAATFFAGSANAVLLDFRLTGDYTGRWQIDSDPAPNEVSEQGYLIYDVTFPDSLLGYADFHFDLDQSGGGLRINDYNGEREILDTTGPQLFTGTQDRPTFRTGRFALSQVNGAGQYVLRIAPASEVPEPMTWAMMMVGSGIVGTVARRRRRRSVIA